LLSHSLIRQPRLDFSHVQAEGVRRRVDLTVERHRRSQDLFRDLDSLWDGVRVLRYVLFLPSTLTAANGVDIEGFLLVPRPLIIRTKHLVYGPVGVAATTNTAKTFLFRHSFCSLVP